MMCCKTVAAAVMGLMLATISSTAGQAWIWSSRQAPVEVTLLEGFMADGGRVAGLDIDLKQGFKTYWRTPGDTGIVPNLILKTSRNVESVEIKWPEPSYFDDEYGFMNGYASDIVLPVLITPEDPSAPIHFDAHFVFGVCKDVCIPTEVDVYAAISPEVNSSFGRISRALARVPKNIDPETLALEGWSLRTIETQPTLKIEIEAPVAATVFIEGQSPDVVLRPQVITPGNHRLVFEFMSLSSEKQAIGEFQVTVVPDNGKSFKIYFDSMGAMSGASP